MILEIRSPCVISTKGHSWLEPLRSHITLPSPLGCTVMVKELPVPRPIACSSKLHLSYQQTHTSEVDWSSWAPEATQFNYRLLANFKPSTPKEHYGSLKQCTDKPGGRDCGLSPARRSQTRAYSHILTLSEIKVYVL